MVVWLLGPLEFYLHLQTSRIQGLIFIEFILARHWESSQLVERRLQHGVGLHPNRRLRLHCFNRLHLISASLGGMWITLGIVGFHVVSRKDDHFIIVVL